MKKIRISLLILAVGLLLLFVIHSHFAIIYKKHAQSNDQPYPKPENSNPGPGMWPSEWIWLQRTFPYGEAAPDAYTSAIKSARVLKKTSITTDIEWEFTGPVNIGGRIVDIEFDPQNPDLVYAAAATGGVFKSIDGGFNWFPVFDDQAVLSIGDIGIDPVNPDVIYVGTGEANGGHNNFPGGGIYKSENGGDNWTYMGLENTRSIGRVLVNPENPEQIFVAAVGSYFGPDPYRGVYVSNNGGESWENSLYVSDSTGAIDLIMDPQNPDFMMTAMWERVRRPVYNNKTHLFGETSGIYKTLDGGDNWELLGPANGLPDPSIERIGRIGLALYPQNADSIYALFTDGIGYTGLYRSVDRGENWKKLDPQNQISTGTGGFSWYFGQIRVRPHDPETVYALDVAFMRSRDGGNTWPLNDGYGNDKGLHVDHHALAFHPEDPNYIIDGNDGGINISQDGGDTWEKIAVLPVTQFYEIGLDPQNPERLYGGSQDNGTLRTVDGSIDTWHGILGGDGFYTLVDPDDPEIIYAESQFGNLYRIDHGIYSNLLNTEMNEDDRNWSTPVIMDPEDNNVLYYGASRLYRTENRGDSWETISGDLTRGLPDSRLGTITTIAVAPSDPDVLYVGTDDGLVWVSQDHGDTWVTVSDSLPFRWVTRIVVDPLDEGTAIVTYSGLKWKESQPHIFRTTDFGDTWKNITGNLPDAPVNAFAIDPKNNEILYCGSDVGVFVSFNTGESWSLLGANLPVVVINDMEISESDYQLVIGTYGRSMYRLDLSQVTEIYNSEISTKPVKSFQLYQNFPNPFNQSTQIRFNLPESGTVRIAIFDLLGHEVYRYHDQVYRAGAHSVLWNGSNNQKQEVASGIYYLSLYFSGKRKNIGGKKLVIIR